jgi:hypothetical protein
MERIDKYREIILKVFREHTEVPSAYWDLIDEIIVDREAERYLWMIRGYQKHKRIHACIVRIDIINGKLWIQQDNTEGVAPELERYGVPKEHIVLGFRAPDMRQYTEYAVE